MDKIKVTQDFLYQYLLEHNFTISMLANKMGVSNAILSRSFRHMPNRLGKTMYLSAANIARLNVVLEQVADELRGCVLNFGSPQTYTNLHGRTYDPALVDVFKDGAGKYFNLTGLTERVLGWNVNRKRMTLSIEKSPIYGNISKQDADRINAELLSVAGVLSSYEVVADEGSSSDSSDDGQTADLQPQAPANADAYYKRLDQFIGAISDTTLPLTERYRIFHERYPDGIIFFRVNDGYTVAQDDARRLVEYDSNIYPYTDMSSGLTTAYMSADIYKTIEEKCISKGWQTVVVEMY